MMDTVLRTRFSCKREEDYRCQGFDSLWQRERWKRQCRATADYSISPDDSGERLSFM